MPQLVSESEYLTLAMLDYILHGCVSGILNESGESHKTICPSCKVDDFAHVSGCAVERNFDEKVSGI